MVEEKKKKKKWFPILASKEFKEMEIGEIPAESSEVLIGKTLSVPLSLLTNDMKKQGILVTFTVTNTTNKITTEVKKIELQPTSVKRAARRGKGKIDDSFKLKTKDNISLVLKPLLLTKSKTTKLRITSIRNQTRIFLTEKIKSLNYSDVIHQIVMYKIQKELKDNIKKIYPISFCQIRSMIKTGGSLNATPSNKQ